MHPGEIKSESRKGKSLLVADKDYVREQSLSAAETFSGLATSTVVELYLRALYKYGVPSLIPDLPNEDVDLTNPLGDLYLHLASEALN